MNIENLYKETVFRIPSDLLNNEYVKVAITQPYNELQDWCTTSPCSTTLKYLNKIQREIE